MYIMLILIDVMPGKMNTDIWLPVVYSKCHLRLERLVLVLLFFVWVLSSSQHIIVNIMQFYNSTYSCLLLLIGCHLGLITDNL